MYRFCVLVGLALFVAGGQAAADRAIAPADPPKIEGPKIEGMVTDPAPAEEAVAMPKEAEGLPDYRGAQKPDMPEVPSP